MPSAAASVIPNDEKRPTSAAASDGKTTSVSTLTLRPTIGASRTAVAAASAPATMKLTSSMVVADHPDRAATRRFSATADVASPNIVRAYTTHRIVVATTTIPSRISLSSGTMSWLVSEIELVGRKDIGVSAVCGLKITLTRPWPSGIRPSVAISLPIIETSRSTRMINTCMTAPIAAPSSSVSASASGHATPWPRRSKKKKADSAPSEPAAKFSTPDARYVTTMPSAIIAYSDPVASPRMANWTVGRLKNAVAIIAGGSPYPRG